VPKQHLGRIINTKHQHKHWFFIYFACIPLYYYEKTLHATFILFSLMLHLGIDFIEANATKSALCLIFSFVSLCLFALNDNVNWYYGGCLAVGSYFGGYIGSKFAVKENTRKWVFILLIALISLEILHMIIKNL
jgi:uncharacterized membrane protein YfcA